jgi:hypothetical protein
VQKIYLEDTANNSGMLIRKCKMALHLQSILILGTVHSSFWKNQLKHIFFRLQWLWGTVPFIL